MVVEQILVGPMAVFCYLVACPQTGEAVLIDPAGDEERILQVLTQKKWRPLFLLNTHGHPDHTCGNQFIARQTGVKIVMHEADARIFDNPAARQMAGQMGFRPSPAVDRTVKEGDHIQFGKESLQVIHTPGHTPGSMCLYGKKNLFTGDTLFVGAVGRTDLPGGSFQVLLNSLQHKVMPLPDDTIVWPGHDYGEQSSSTVGWEKKTNPYFTDFF
ncbi:MAG: MBL fold metallo-hydrolase [Desulfobacca sp.]|nr:MBL fold metallo-hydrolase [Desulfobacca sp.]